MNNAGIQANEQAIKLKTGTRMTGAQAILESFIKEGADIVFGYPGGAIMPLYDALYDYRQIRHILTRHEQGAVHAAEGYARMSGKPGVCIATSGPGATNLITGITDAMIDSIPLVCITGQVAAESLGTDAFQEAAIIGMTTPITKWCYQVTHAEEIPEIMAKAFHIARTGRPGPVLIDITKNAQTGTFDFLTASQSQADKNYPVGIKSSADEKNTTSESASRSYKINLKPDLEKIKQAADLLNGAKRPYILAGHGILISKAEKELLKFAEKGGFPIASTLLGLSAIRADHPLYMGMLGMHGNYGANKCINQADIIFAIGMRFDDRVTGKTSEYAKNAKIIHIDIDNSELHKVIKADVAIQADAKEALSALIPLIEPLANPSGQTEKSEYEDWIKKFRDFDKEEYSKVSDAELHPKSGQMTMAEVIRTISEKTKGEAVILADVGQHQMATARYYKFLKNDSFITSGGLGTMGFALPASIGAMLAVQGSELSGEQGNGRNNERSDSKGRDVIAVIGDGSFQMTMQELGTIAQEKLPIKIIILNNHHLGMVRQWQEMFYEERYSCVSMENPEFTIIADAYKIKNRSIQLREELDGAIDDLLSSSEPYLLDIHVRKEEKIFPIMPSGASVDDIRLE